MSDTFIASVVDLSLDGLGVCRHPDGRVFFVPGVWPGEKAEVKIQSTKKNFGLASLNKLIETHPQRLAPPCPYQGESESSCGGCRWMFVSYDEQILQKQKITTEFLKRKLILPANVSNVPIQPSSKSLGYRNRVKLSSSATELGFQAPSTNQIVAIDHCLVLEPNLNQKLELLNRQGSYQPGYYEFDTDSDPDILNPNQPTNFRQANTEQNEFIRGWIGGHWQAQNETDVLELFCGNGNFTEILVKNFRTVTSLESSRAATEELEAKKLPNLQVSCTDLYKISLTTKATHLLLDPPRSGYKNLAALLSRNENLREFIYVSCDRNSFAKDLVKLSAEWRLIDLQLVDMFPQTPHVELLALFRR